VLFADPKARVIGAAHAGWKGAFGGVIEATVQAMETLGGRKADIHAAIGPLIRQPSYEVGAEFVERFTATDAANVRYFVPSSKTDHSMFDLAGFIRTQLERAGIEAIDDVGIDTYADPRFFSYRRTTHRTEPDYGRNIHALVLD
jgi:YfiH family protein